MSERYDAQQGEPYPSRGPQAGGPTPPQSGYPPHYQQQYFQQQPPQKKKRGRGCLWMILGALLFIVLVIVGVMALVGSAADKVDKDINAQHKVTYKVTGDSSADLTYSTDTNASTSQESNAKLPWSKTLSVKGLTAGMSVQAQNDGSGKFSCEIDVDGKSVKQATSSGQGSIADCTAP